MIRTYNKLPEDIENIIATNISLIEIVEMKYPIIANK